MQQELGARAAGHRISRSAQVVHVDYSICFDRGQRLRVPERVPFRFSERKARAALRRGTGLLGCTECLTAVLRVLPC